MTAESMVTSPSSLQARRDHASWTGDASGPRGARRAGAPLDAAAEWERRRSAEQAASVRLSQKALRDTSLAELLDDATFTLADTLGVDASTVFLFDDDDPAVLRLAAGFGCPAEEVGTLRVQAMGSVAGLALARREVVEYHAGRDDDRFPASRHLAEDGLVSTIVGVIEGPDHAFGALGAHARTARAFTRDDELFLQTVANVVGAAVMRDRAELALMEAEEAERRRIAEAVHDDTLQVMIAIAMRLEGLERQSGTPELRDRVHELAIDTREAAKRLRALAFDLFPEDLASGLEVVLRRLLGEVGTEAGFEFDLTVDLHRPPPQTALRTLYRNIQEAVVNIRKHARARHVVVTVRAEGDGTAVHLADDGVGISPELARDGRRGHLGIKGLRERTVRCGGRITIGPGPAGGTVIDFWLPNTPVRAIGAD